MKLVNSKETYLGLDRIPRDSVTDELDQDSGSYRVLIPCAPLLRRSDQQIMGWRMVAIIRLANGHRFMMVVDPRRPAWRKELLALAASQTASVVDWITGNADKIHPNDFDWIDRTIRRMPAT